MIGDTITGQYVHQFQHIPPRAIRYHAPRRIERQPFFTPREIALLCILAFVIFAVVIGR